MVQHTNLLQLMPLYQENFQELIECIFLKSLDWILFQSTKIVFRPTFILVFVNYTSWGFINPLLYLADKK